MELKDILAAKRTVAGLVRRTPLRFSFALSQRVGSQVYLKLENWQVTGAFKVRGAINKLASLSPQERAGGVITASSGNFAVGVAYAARALGGVPATIVMPEGTPLSKVDKLEEYGGGDFEIHVLFAGADYDLAYEAAVDYHRRRGGTYVHSFDDPLVIAGQGTVGLEIVEDVPDVEAILVPIGGGGLLSGVAVAAQALNPAVRIIGVQVEASPSAYLSFRDGRPYERYRAAPTIAEGLAGGFGRLPFEIMRHRIEEVVLVSEEEMCEAVRVLLEREQLVVESSAAVGVAALLSGKVRLPGKRVAVVLSGGNVDARLLGRIVGR